MERNLARYGIPLRVAKKYAAQLEQHIAYVCEASKVLGVSLFQYATHDLSKWSDDEFPGYAMHYFGGGDPESFARAWTAHMHKNKHHWQFWLLPYGTKVAGRDTEVNAIEMPYEYVLEMVADWMGASKTYTGEWDIEPWLKEHLPKIVLHPVSAVYLREILGGIGYPHLMMNVVG